MFKYICLTLITLLAVKSYSQDHNEYELFCSKMSDSLHIHLNCRFSNSDNNRNYLVLAEGIKVQSLFLNDKKTQFEHVGDTLWLHTDMNLQAISMDYDVPMATYTASDGGFYLRRECAWYPKINDELLSANIHIEDSSCYIVSGSEQGTHYQTDLAYEMHLFMMPKQLFNIRIEKSQWRPLLFYTSVFDTTQYNQTFFDDFTNSYNFYAKYFNDSITDAPLHIVNVFDSAFDFGQSLSNAIVFGNNFYHIYTYYPSATNVPHEVAHLWWGNRLFCDRSAWFWSESIVEYLKIQWAKQTTNKYDSLMYYYNAYNELITEKEPIGSIEDIQTISRNLIIYNYAPWKLELLSIQHPELQMDDYIKTIYLNYRFNLVNAKQCLEVANPKQRRIIMNLLK